jgi:hypothetical protein
VYLGRSRDQAIFKTGGGFDRSSTLGAVETA